MHILVRVECFHLGMFSKKSSAMDLWNWLIASADQNADYTPTTNLNRIAKLVATFTALKRTTKHHRATTNTGFVITIV